MGTPNQAIIRCSHPACATSGGAIVATIKGDSIAVEPSTRLYKRDGMAVCAACNATKYSDPDTARQGRNTDAVKAAGWAWNGGNPKQGKAPEAQVQPAPLPVTAGPTPPAAKGARPPKPGTVAAPPVAPAAPPVPSIDAAIDAAAVAIATAIGARFAASLRPRVAASVSDAIVTAIRDAGQVQ